MNDSRFDERIRKVDDELQRRIAMMKIVNTANGRENEMNFRRNGSSARIIDPAREREIREVKMI